MNKKLVCLILAAAVMAPLGYAYLLSNWVTNGTITVDGSRDDWSGLTSYSEDGQEIDADENDWRTFTMAHDSTNLYIRYTTWKGPGWEAGWGRYSILIDIDQDRDTGYNGGYLSVGGDLLIQASTLYTFAGAHQSDFSWSFLELSSYNVLSNDYELAFSRSSLSLTNGAVINWIGLAINNSTYDFVPNDANGGETGGYHSYAIPEPASVALLSIGVLCALALRSRSAKV